MTAGGTLREGPAAEPTCDSLVKMSGGGAPVFEIANPCIPANGFEDIIVEPRGRELRLSFARGVRIPVQIDVFQQSRGRTLIGNRLVARFDERTGGLLWSGRANRDGTLVSGPLALARAQAHEPLHGEEHPAEH